MEDLNISVFGTALGLAFIMVGLGITYAYRRILPYRKRAASDDQRPPEMLIRIFTTFMWGAGGALAFGVLLVIAANLIGPGLTVPSKGISVPISLYYAAALGLLLIILTYNVLHYRVKAAITSTDEDNAKGDQIARVHGNFTEYVPTGLALLILLEWSGAPAFMVHFGGALFTAARYLHAWGYTTNPYASFGRIIGIQSTLLALSYMVVAAAYYLFLA